MERGLRQGNPLYPLLFLLVGEALQVAILEACNKGMFKGISLSGEEPNLSLLQYADDTLFFGEWSRLNASNLIHILKCFEGSSGLKVNISKSRIFGIGVCIADVDQVASMRSCGGWNGVVDMFNARLSAWNAKNLSIGGRLTLVKSVLDSQRGMCWVKWDSILLDANLGGLGVDSIAFMVTKVDSVLLLIRPGTKVSGRAISDLNTLLSVIGDYGLDGSRDDSYEQWTWIFRGCLRFRPGLRKILELVRFCPSPQGSYIPSVSNKRYCPREDRIL
ncbi:reverse transcriptase domain, reverse transcriptase zinc-binding domain protein [Tanacetum coccineum]